MTRTNARTRGRGIGLALLLGGGCDAATIRPAREVVAVEAEMHQSAASSTAEVLPAVPVATASEAIVVVPVDKPSDEEVLDSEVEEQEECTPPQSGEVVHYAELRGRIETQAGNRLTIEPLVVTSATLPVPGCLANMWIEAQNAEGNLDWRHFAEVKVATTLRFGMPMEVELIEPIKGHEKPEALPPGSRVRIQWMW
jgi:hypothetical protein